MSVELLNFIETVLNGLMSGIMYSLVALGFVLIFKASGVFNFAQGVFASPSVLVPYPPRPKLELGCRSPSVPIETNWSGPKRRLRRVRAGWPRWSVRPRIGRLVPLARLRFAWSPALAAWAAPNRIRGRGHLSGVGLVVLAFLRLSAFYLVGGRPQHPRR